jgi:hypothetical protein
MTKQLNAAESPFETKPKPALPFVGWYRSRGTWQKVVEAQTERECWRLLLAYRDPHSVECERCVLKRGALPPTRGRGERE